MRSLLYIFCLSFSLQIAAQSSSKNLGEFIYNVPFKKNITVGQLQSEWWNEYLEYPIHEGLFKRLLEKIDSGKIQARKAIPPFDQILSSSEIKDMLHQTDTAQLMDENTGEFYNHIIQNDFYFDRITSITFVEDWSYDKTTFLFTKKVKGMILNKEDKERSSSDRLMELPLFYIPMNNLEAKVQIDLFDLRNVPFITYGLHLGMQYKDSAQASDEQASLQKFIQSISDSPKEIKKNVYDTLFPYTSKPEKTTLNALIPKLGAANEVKFYEEWKFDLGQMTFEKKVKGVILQETKTKEDVTSKKKIAFIALNGFVPADPFNKTKVHVDEISSDVVFANFNSIGDLEKRNKVSNGDSSKLTNAGINIAQDVKDHKVKAYPHKKAQYDDPWDHKIHIAKSNSDVDLIFSHVDTLLNVPSTTGMWDSSHVRVNLDLKGISGFRFYESWNFDLKTLHFEKKIKTFAPTFKNVKIRYGEEEIVAPLFNIDVPSFATSTVCIPQNRIANSISYNVPIDWDVENADKFSVIKQNWEIYWMESWEENLYQLHYYPLVQGILEQVLSGKLKAIDPLTNSPIPSKDIKIRLESLKDSSFVKPIDISTDYTLVNRLRFTEDWYFDPATKAFYKKVNSITFVHSVGIHNDERRIYKWKENPIFTVNLN